MFKQISSLIKWVILVCSCYFLLLIKILYILGYKNKQHEGSFKKRLKLSLGMVVLTFDSSTPEAEETDLCVPGQPRLQSASRASPGYTVKPCLKKPKLKNPTLIAMNQGETAVKLARRTRSILCPRHKRNSHGTAHKLKGDIGHFWPWPDSLSTHLTMKRSPFNVQSVGKLDFSVGGLAGFLEKDSVLMAPSLKLLYQLTTDRVWS